MDNTADLRRLSLDALDRARKARACAEAAQQRAIRCENKATISALSAVARIIASRAALRRNTDRQS
jgi:hypothetical protein